MTKEEILEGNKLIAEFMGFPKVKPMSKWDYDRSLDNATTTVGLVVNEVINNQVSFHQKMPYKSYDINYFDGNTFWPEGFKNSHHAPCRKYSEQWQWLMPVVEKIEKDTSASIYHRFTVVIADVYCHIKCHEKGKQDGVLYQTPYGTTPESKISEVWQAVIQFIQWYNSTNPTTIK